MTVPDDAAVVAVAQEFYICKRYKDSQPPSNLDRQYAREILSHAGLVPRDETSDAVRGDLHGTPGEWPERQPTDPDRGQLRDAATPACGRGRQSDDAAVVEAAARALMGA